MMFRPLFFLLPLIFVQQLAHCSPYNNKILHHSVYKVDDNDIKIVNVNIERHEHGVFEPRTFLHFITFGKYLGIRFTIFGKCFCMLRFHFIIFGKCFCVLGSNFFTFMFYLLHFLILGLNSRNNFSTKSSCDTTALTYAFCHFFQDFRVWLFPCEGNYFLNLFR